MARKTFNVDLIFGADTSRAKQAMKELNTSLKSLNDSNINKLASGINPDIEKSILKVQQLKDAFQRATDPKTGQLNLAQLNRSLEVSGQKFSDFADDFSKLGKQGQESYINMAKAISSAQQPIIKTNALVDKLWNSLKNVATWQISSTVLNSFTGAFQDAFYYAKDLNRSLNDIRIVTSYSTDKMADFAKEANKAAKSLSTTTNEYAKASLIYFQQGLSDSQVKERTDVTTKLANVSRESAETVSEWMTAIWNNFDNGTKSLEKYADTLTALGAATASSADEIATGLEKFSAIADTVGLSYDYAAAALATVTSQTRQSADVVGTAFRTLFARLEGLQLGETLDDGVTLNKYSQALNTVGVNIMNASGELKSMDTILEELGQRWGSLDQAQKVALATTVGGVRQYNTLISLMDNWGIFQDNLNISINSTGALQEQADIYAESWEAASDKVTASLETIYDQLINDEALIDLTNMAAGFLDIVSQLIDSMGGLKGLLPGIIALMLQLFGDKMLAGAKSMTQFATMEQLKTQEQAKKLKQEASETLGNYGDSTSVTGAALQDFYDGTTKDLKELGGIFRELDDNQKELFKQILESNRSTRESMIKAAERVQSDLQDIGYKGAMGREDVLNEDGGVKKFLTERSANIESLLAQAKQKGTIKSRVTAKDIINNNQEFFDSLGVTTNPEDPEIANKKLITSKAQLSALLDEENAKLLEATNSVENFNNAVEEESKAVQENQKIIKGFNTKSIQENFMDLTQASSTFAFSLSSLVSIWDVLNNTEMTFGEKLLAIIPSLIMGIGGVRGSIKQLQSIQWQSFGAQIKDILATEINTKAKKDNTDAIGKNIEVRKDSQKEIAKTAEANISEAITDESGNVFKKTVGKGNKEYFFKNGKRIKAAEGMSAFGKSATTKAASGAVVKGAGGAAAAGGGLTVGSILLPILIIAAVAAAIAGIRAAWEEFTSIENRVKKQKEALDQWNQEVEKTRQGYDSLKNSISNITSARDSIDSMIQGTTEWKEAVWNLNQEVLGLMEKYPELSKYVKFEDGVATIQKMEDGTDALEYIQQKEFEKLQNQTVSQRVMQLAIQKGEAAAARQNIARDSIGYWDSLDDAYSSLGSTLTTIFAPGGPWAGAAFAEQENQILMQNILDQISKEYKSGEKYDWDNAFENLSEGNEDVYNALKENKDTIIQQIQAEQKQTEATKALRQTMIDEANRDNDAYTESNYKDQIAIIASRDSNVAEREAVAKARVESLSKEQKAQLYAEMLGEDYRAVDTGGGNFTVEKRTADGASWETVGNVNSVSYGGLDETLIEYLTYTKNLSEAEIARAEREAYENDVQLYDAGIRGDVRKELLNEILKTEKTKNIIDLSSLTREQVNELNKQLAGITKDSLRDRITEAIEGYDEALRKRAIALTEKWINEEDIRETRDEQEIRDKAGMSEEDYENYLRIIVTLNPALAKNREQIEDVARANARLNSGMGSVVKKYVELEEALRGNKGKIEYAKAVNAMSTELEYLFNLEEETLDDQFIVEQFDNITEAVNGNEDAVKSLYVELSKVKAAEAKLYNMQEGTDAIGVKNSLISLVESYGQQIINAAPNMSLQAILGEEADRYINKLNDGLSNGVIAAEDLQAVFANLGLDLEIVENKIQGLSSLKINLDFTDFESRAEEIDGRKKDIERYHYITETLEDLERQYDRISKAKDRAFGPDKLALMDQERIKLKEIEAAEQDYLDEAAGYLESDKNILLQYGVKLDGAGRIENYDDILSQYASKSDEEWDKINEAIKNYEESLNTWEEQQKVVAEKTNELKDLALEKIEYKIEYKIEIDEDEIKHLDYLLAAAGESVDKAADRIANLGRKYEIANNQIAIYEESIRQVFGESYAEDLLSGNVNLKEVLASGQLTDKQIEKLRNYRDELYNINDILKETAETINENLVNALDEMNEEYEKSYDNLEHLDKIYKSYKDIVDIVGKNKLGISNEAIRQMTQAQLENANAALKIAEAQKNAAQSNYDEIANLYKQDNEMYKEAMQEAEEALEEAQENFMDRWQTALTAAADAFKENVELIAEEFSSAVGGIYGSIENMSQAFDRQKQIGELYFQDYKKVYEISKLNRQITQTMEKNDNVKSQRQYNELLAEVNEYSKEGVKMSEYDLGYLQKKYDLIQAQMALEEAQNAKNQMTLQRDSEGNWGYVYTADQSKIDDSKQKYEDAVYAMQDFKWQSEMELQGQYLDYIQQYEEGLLALAEKYGTESEEYKKGADELAAHFSALTGYTLEELQEMVSRGLGLYNEFGVKTAQTYEETILGQMNTSLGSFSKLQEETNKAITDSINALKLSHESFSLKVSETFDNAGSSVDGFKTEYTNAANTASTEADKIVTKTGEMQIKFSSSFGLMVESITKWYNTYGTVIDSIIGPKGKNDKLIKSIDEVIKKYEEFKGIKDDLENDDKGLGATGGSNDDSSKNSLTLNDILKEDALKASGSTKVQDVASSGYEAGNHLQLSQVIDSAGKKKTVLSSVNAEGEIQAETNQGYLGTLLGNDGSEEGMKQYLRDGYLEEYLTWLNNKGKKNNDESFLEWIESMNIETNRNANTTTSGMINLGKLDNEEGNNEEPPSPPKNINTQTILNTIDSDASDEKQAVEISVWRNSMLSKKAGDGKRKFYTGNVQRIQYQTSKNDGRDVFQIATNLTGGEGFPDIFYTTAEEIKKLFKYSVENGSTPLYFDTGGYTGEWGPEGRLAMLHQKEIVLNATDTENLLRTIDMVRSFNDRVEQSARMAALGLSNIGGIASYPRGGDTLQQEVTIHAEFPNVTDHNEIELALNNLVNDASQYANRKD